MNSIETLPLHDAILNNVNVDWINSKISLSLQVFMNNSNASPHLLTFKKFTNIAIPHNSPWGDSKFINSVSYELGAFKLEMQSGDIIKIDATSYTFEPLLHNKIN